MNADERPCNFDEIDEPGTYLEGRWGTLFRMPENLFPRKRRHTAPLTTRERWLVVRISKDPWISLAAALKIADAMGVRVML